MSGVQFEMNKDTVSTIQLVTGVQFKLNKDTVSTIQLVTGVQNNTFSLN